MANYPDWFLKQPYRPRQADRGDHDRANLHVAVGLICHNWEHLEGRLYDLYVALFSNAHPAAPNYRAYQASYSAIVSSKARMEVIISMLDASFLSDSSAHREIFPLLKLIGRATGRRNEAAHGIVVAFNTQKDLGGGASCWESKGLFVMPPRYAPDFISRRSGVGPPPETGFKYRYNSQQLSEIAILIRDLGDHLDQKTRDLESGVIGAFRERRLLPSVRNHTGLDIDFP